MLEPGGGFDLAEEALGSEGGGQLGAEHLDALLVRLVSQVFGEIDRGHAAATELALDDVAVGQGGLKAIDGGIGQSGTSERNSTRLALGLETNQWQGTLTPGMDN